MSFESFFGQDIPFPFQKRFHACEAENRILEVPTGLGKTKTVIADWLARGDTTRMAYCLPGRALTRQVWDVAKEMAQGQAQVIELMGGSEDLDDKIGPDQRVILVGTQDVLVSRALNRGYAQSPFRWPIDFGLLNNDITWVFDEVQLLGDVVATSAQLAGFRKEFKVFGRVRCVWMSATFDHNWLHTVDFPEEPAAIQLEEDDRKIPEILQRLEARKTVEETRACDTPRECAIFVKARHTQGTLTLVICNTVARAQGIWGELRKLGAEPTLVHSRFRPKDRPGLIESGILVATQVIEAGLDIDSHLMVTDAAPWSSLVQRFGRVNRRGGHEGQIYWVRHPQSDNKRKTDGKEYLPYDAKQVREDVSVLEGLRSAAPNDLPRRSAPKPYRFVLRRSDLLDLFDTTPDLAGNQVDVSRFVRSGEETNVYVAWRDWAKEEAPPKKRFVQEELCPVPHVPGGNKELRDVLKRSGGGWVWSYTKQGRWEKVGPQDPIYAGMRLLLRSEAGGYVEERGWTPSSTAYVSDLCPENVPEDDSMDGDRESETIPQSIEEHTDEVVREMRELLDNLRVDLNGTRTDLEHAARWHDWGKAHPVFQQTLHKMSSLPEDAPAVLLAKQARGKANHKHSRKWFRHELGSALAMWAEGHPMLARYLVAAHHGKVRVNIRSMPGEVISRDFKKRLARGIEEGDVLFPVALGGGVAAPQTVVDLGATELGSNWTDEVASLIEDSHGPFRLAYLECLLRMADERASEKAKATQ